MSRGRRILLWAGLAIAALALVLGLGAWLALRTGAVHNYLLREARARATAAAGVPVGIGNVQLHLHGLAPTLEVDDVTVAGAAPYTAPPLLRLASARVRVRITSLIPFRWRVRSVELLRPVVHLVFVPGGGTNLPHPAGSAGGRGLAVFQFAVGRAAVRGGEVVVNARAVPLEADLRDLRVDAAYVPADQAYRGSLGFSGGSLQAAGLPALTHAFAANFLATASGASFTGVRWTTPGATLTAAATLRDYAHPRIAAGYRLRLRTAALRRRLRLSALPSGEIAASGQAHYSAAGFTTQGEFSSPAFPAAYAGIAASVTRLAGRYAYAGGALTLTHVQAVVLGGSVQATLAIRDLAHRAAARLDLRLTGARLEDAAALYARAHRTLGQLGIHGRLSAAVHARWQGAFRDVALDATGSLAAALPSAPLNATVQAHYAAGVLRLAAAELHTPRSYLRARGTLDGRASLRIAAGSSDLRELDALARELAPVLTGRPLPAYALSGAATFHGAVSGSPAAPRISGRLRLAPFVLGGSRWRSIEFAVTADPSRVELADLRAAPAAGGALSAHLTLGLSGFVPQPSSPVQAAIEIRALPLTAIAAPLRRALPVSGRLTAQADVSGTFGRPQLRGTASLASARLLLGGVAQPITSATVSFHGSAAGVGGTLRLALPAGALTAGGSFQPPSGAYQVSLDAPRLDLGRLAWVTARRLPLAGAVALAAAGRGTLAAPAGTLSLTSARLTAAGQSITAVNLHATLSPGRVEAQLAATALETPLHAEAQIALTSALPATVHIDAPAVPIGPLIAAFAPSLAGKVQGRTAVQAELHGPLRDPAALQASLALPALELSYALPEGAAPAARAAPSAPAVLRLAAAAPLRLTLAGGVLTLAPAALTGTDTALTLEARVPLGGGPMRAVARGTVGLRLAQAFVPGTAFGGEAALNLAVTGPLQRPVFGGEIALAGASVANPAFPLTLSNGHGLLRLSARRLDIANFTADAGGGLVTLTGGMVLRPALRFDFGLAARNLGVRYPDTLRELVSADLTLTGTPRAAQLNGRAHVTRVSVLPGFDFTRFVGRLAAAAPAVSAPGSFAQALALNVSVTTPNRIAIATPDFSLDANANLYLRGTAAEPVLLGRMDLDRGDIIFNGQRYQFNSGALAFTNPARTDPVVNVSATTTISQYELYLNFQGPVSNLRTTYTSTPPLPPADIIHLLAFGSTTEVSAANPLPGNLGAENLIAGAVSAQITGRVQKLAGISQLSIDPLLRGASQNAGARITVQQRVTGNLFVTFSTDTTGTTRNVVEIQYSLTPRVSLSAVRDQNGGFGVSARFKKVW